LAEKGDFALKAPIRVLCVDDEQTFLEVTQECLRLQGGFEVDSASSVKEACVKMMNNAYDAVVCDYQMPEKDGLQFLMELRAGGNRIPFILFTGKGREEVAVKAVNFGADGYVEKKGSPETVYCELAHYIRQAVQRARVESKLKASEEKYRNLFENTGAATCIIEEDKTISLCNKQFEKLSGYSKEEIEGNKKWTEFVTKDYLEKMEKYHDERRKEGGKAPNQYVFNFVNKKGEIKTILLTVDVIPRTKKSLASLVDITEQQQLKMQLKEVEEKYQDIFEQAPVGIITIDVNGVVTAVNAAVVSISGFSREEFVGKHFSKLDMLKSCIPELVKIHDSLLKGIIPKPFEIKYCRKEGKVAFGEVYISLINEVGIVKGFQVIIIDISERRKAEKALKASEEKYRSLINGMNDTVWVIGFDGKFIDVNAAAVKVLGYSREELLSMKVTDIDGSLNSEEIGNLIKNIPADQIQVFETTHVTKDGRKIPVEISSTIISYQDKKAILSIARDITYRKRLELELKCSEEKYRKQFEETPDAIFLAEADTGIIVDCNHAATQLLGRDKSELIGKHQRILHPPQSIEDGFSRTFKQHREEKKMSVFEDQIITKNGEIRDVQISATIFDIAGKRIMQGTFRDVTEQKRVKKALQEAEEKYRETIMNADVGIIAYDVGGKLKIINPKMEEITGFTIREIPTLNEWFKKLYPNETERHKIANKWHKRILEEGKVKEGYATITTKDGKRRVFLFNGVLLRSGDTLAFAQDVTERKEAEEKLAKLTNKLMFMNEKLSVISKWTRHDARNKLSVIESNVYLAKKKLPTNNFVLPYLDAISSACKQMVKIFDFAKAYESLGMEEPAYVDVEKSFEEAAALVSDIGDVKIKNNCHGLMVLADSQLRQLFYNFIDNSLRHGKKVSQISLYYKEDETHGELKLVYEDNGVGITDDVKRTLFKEETGKSTGHGLYLMAKLCEIYGWTIKETGEAGKGAQFAITISKTKEKGKPPYKLQK